MYNSTYLKQIKGIEPDFLEKAKKTGYVCTECGNGTGETGSGISRYGENRWKCQKCGADGDVIDWYMRKYRVSFGEAVRRLGARIGLDHDNSHPSIEKNDQLSAQQKEEQRDYTDFFREAESNLSKTDYLTKRGISKKVQEEAHCGYVEDLVLEKDNGAAVHAGPRAIIPTSNSSYVARSIDKGTNEKFKVVKQGKVNILFEDALNSDEVIIVVEGEIDALSIKEAGGVAVSVGGTSGLKPLKEALERSSGNGPLVIALDNDKAGKDAAKRFLEGLKDIGRPVFTVNELGGDVGPLYGDFKDANERLVADREGLERAIAAVTLNARVKLEEESKAERTRYESNSVAGHLQGLIDEIARNKDIPPYATGFRDLDKELYGGFRGGQLVILGAVSSLGKTTYMLQMAANMAEAGFDVLYISLEMSELELTSKVISRYTYEYSIKEGRNADLARTTFGIMDGRNWEGNDPEQTKAIRAAIERLEDSGKHLYIIPSTGSTSVADIDAKVKEHVRKTGRKPLVMLDYLQILTPLEKDEKGRTLRYASDKAVVDMNIHRLKTIAVTNDVPVLCISSLNRENYAKPISMAAFKESGNLEYSADILLGLQYVGMREISKKDAKKAQEIFDEAEMKSRRGEPLDIELRVLKFRNAPQNTIRMLFFSRYNFFKEVEPIMTRSGKIL